jgi:hypothetical protein
MANGEALSGSRRPGMAVPYKQRSFRDGMANGFDRYGERLRRTGLPFIV